MHLLAGITSGPYRVVLLLHILCAIVGLGGVMLNGVYGAASRKAVGRGATALVHANATATKVAEFFIYAVPLLGFALIGMSDDAWQFDQTWIWLSVVFYAVALAISLGLLLPAFRTYVRTITEVEAGTVARSPAVDATLDGLAKKQAALGGTLHVITVVLLYLMIWKPGA
jgi:hypothetical protein